MIDGRDIGLNTCGGCLFMNRAVSLDTNASMALVPMMTVAARLAERDEEEAAEESRTKSTLSNLRNRMCGRAGRKIIITQKL